VEIPDTWTTHFFGPVLTITGQTGALSVLAVPPDTYSVSSVEDFSKQAMDTQATHPGLKMVEPLDMNKYTIGSEKAGTATFLSSPSFRELESQSVFVIHNGKQYIFSYQNVPSIFDTGNAKSIRDHIFKSMKWTS
jgi:hypothetical protein